MTANKSEIAFNELLTNIETHVKDFPLNLAFYRGSNKAAKYELLPSLYRKSDKIKHNLTFTKLENNLFYDFCARTNGIYKAEKDWDTLFKMQHHGFPTRLLDWTESLAVALYFALEYSNEIENPCIWVLSPYKLNDSEKKKNRFTDLDYSTLYNPDRDFKLNYYDAFIVCNAKNQPLIFNQPQALYPIKSNERIIAQWGVFTVHGNDKRCLSKINPESVKKFIIPKVAIPAAKLFLKRAMINHFSMFPDLEGLNKYLRAEYYSDSSAFNSK